MCVNLNQMLHSNVIQSKTNVNSLMLRTAWRTQTSVSADSRVAPCLQTQTQTRLKLKTADTDADADTKKS